MSDSNPLSTAKTRWLLGGSAAAVVLIAALFFGLRRPAPAVEQTPTPKVMTPSEPAGPLADAHQAVQSGDQKTGLAKAEEALHQDPTNFSAQSLVAQLRTEQALASNSPADVKKATDTLSDLEKTKPNYWPALQLRGDLEAKAGHLKQAADYYQRVLKLEPNHPAKAAMEKVIAQAKRSKH